MIRLFTCLVFALAICARAADAPQRLLVAAAADLKFALDDVLAEFRKAHPECDPKTTYGSSGTLFAQIDNGAPFDVFLSADVKFPRELVARGKAVGDSLFSYAIGHVVVWMPNDSPVDVEQLGIKALLDPRIHKVAIANPDVAPYGAAARAALKSLGVYEEIRGKLVLGENVAQTAQFVQSGAADAGLISLSLAVAPKMKDAGHYWEVPVEAFPKLEQAGVICSGATNKTAAAQLCEFLRSPDGRAILRRYGFALPAAGK